MNKILIIFIYFVFILFIRQIYILNANDNTYINTSNIIYDEEKNTVELAENSKINFGNTNILVDRGVIDYDKNEIEVFGNFYLYQETNILSGKDLKGDIKLENFTANKVSFIYNDDLKIDSDSALRSDDEVYFYNNFLTPCELVGYFGCPTWSLRIDKTKYDLNKDKFVHYDTFLQIADYKIFYLPYFSHYGNKAPRQRGFLTPTIEFTIGGNSGVYTPYYLPIKDRTDIKFTPKFIFSQSFDFINNYELNTVLNHKLSGGNLKFEMDNIKNEDIDDINNTVRFNLKQVLDKNKILSLNSVLTNSISTTRSKNEEPIKFEDIYLRLDNYDFALDNDYLRTEISTVEAFDSANVSFIPFSPHINYYNNIKFSKNFSNLNELDFRVIKRNNSQSDIPSENNSLKLNNYFISNNKMSDEIILFNKLSLFNNISNYTFKHDVDLNRSERFHHLILSSDIYYNYFKNIKPRLKLIHNQDIYHSDRIINEDSNSLSFNYQNQFSDNRFFGTDERENTSRIVYGIESDFKFNEIKYDLNFNQSYDFKRDNNFNKIINQESNLSDYSIEGFTELNDINFNFDLRLDRSTFAKREMNARIYTDDPIQISVNYHETDKNAFNKKSNDTEYLGVSLEKEVNDNLILSYSSNIDLKNNFSSYYDTFGLKIFDECSELFIEYSNRRYNDNYNTTPEELLSVNFRMDYLGFFGYQQTTDLFFQEPGNIDYGM